MQNSSNTGIGFFGVVRRPRYQCVMLYHIVIYFIEASNRAAALHHRVLYPDGVLRECLEVDVWNLRVPVEY